MHVDPAPLWQQLAHAGYAFAREEEHYWWYQWAE